jgi:hypothetical protein
MTATPPEYEARICRERLEEMSAYYFQTSRDLQIQLDASRRIIAILNATITQQLIEIEVLKVCRDLLAKDKMDPITRT